MWGGWFKDDDYMSLIAKMSEICAIGMDKPNSDCAIFVDEKCFAKLDYRTTLLAKVLNQVGFSGISYDVYLASDLMKFMKNMILVCLLNLVKLSYCQIA